MTLKRRLQKLEAVGLQDEPTVVIFTTRYEGKNGEIESTYRRAFIDWGSGRNVGVSQSACESSSEFDQRLDDLKTRNLQQAVAYIAESENRDDEATK